MNHNGKKRKWILLAAAGVAVVALGCGIWYYVGHNSADPVYVYPFQYIGMTEYWGDSQESYGPVTTDKIQTVFLSDTQTVTELLVQEGDTVKKGDLLMTFDTALTDLQLERKRLNVEKLKLQLGDAQKELRNINSMKPMEVPEIEPTPEEGEITGTPAPVGLYPSLADTDNFVYDGSSAEKAVIYWIKGETKIADSLFSDTKAHIGEIRTYNALNATEPTEPTDATEYPIFPERPTEAPADTMESTDITEPPAPEGDSPDVTEPAPVPVPVVSDFYVVIKATEGDTKEGATKVWQCLKVTPNGDHSFGFQFADTSVSDHSISLNDDVEDLPQIDLGSGYTAAQIAQMRAEQQKKIRDLEFQIKMADAEYKIMQAEVGDGNVYATIDGKVISCLTEEEAKKTKQPMLKVSGGGGFYVEGYVSELEKDNMHPGQEVTVNDWNTGMTYTGAVQSIGDFPKQNNSFGGNGNPNASFYPFKVFVDEEADLQAGSYVSVVYSAAESENGVYLENPFLRTEQGRTYVLVQGANGKLEQRFVTTRKSLWGSYTQILSGVTADDLIAFPYGKNVKPGVASIEGDLSNLYG